MTSTKKTRKSRKLSLVTAAIVTGLIGVGACSAAATSSHPAAAPATHSSSAPAAHTSAPAPATSAPAPATSAPAKPTAPAQTVSQQQAIEAAQSYLDLGQGFSRAGLIGQLTSSAGGFGAADATYAVNYLHPDWDAQAVLAAKSYLALGGFSKASLIGQLTSSAVGFTLAQATHGADVTMG